MSYFAYTVLYLYLSWVSSKPIQWFGIFIYYFTLKKQNIVLESSYVISSLTL